MKKNFLCKGFLFFMFFVCLFIILPTQSAVGLFDDGAGDDVFLPGQLDIQVEAQNEFSELLGETNSGKFVLVNNQGDFDFNYSVKVAFPNEKDPACDFLDMRIINVGAEQHINFGGKLSEMTEFIPLGTLVKGMGEMLEFNASIAGDDHALEGRSCAFDLVFYAEQSPSGGFSETETLPNVITIGSRLAPELAEFNFEPKTIDISNGSQEMVFILRLVDPDGVSKQTYFQFQAENQEEGRVTDVTKSLYDAELIAGDEKDGTYRIKVDFPEDAAAGKWKLYYYSAWDGNGNQKVLTGSEAISYFESKGFPTGFEVKKEENNLDLETVLVDLQNESPYSPNILGVKAQVKNKNEIVAHNVLIKVSLNDQEIETRGIGMLEKGSGVENFSIPLSANLEGAILRIETIAEGQEDINVSNNVLERPLSVYFVDFQHNRDAFNFPNWGFSNYEEYRQELIDFIKAQWNEGDYHYFLAAILNGAYFNLGGAGGHCYGMMGDSIGYFLWPQTKPLSDETTYNLPKDVAKPNIIQRHWQQVVRVLYPIILPEIEASSYVYSASSQYQQIKDSIENQKEPIGVVLLGSKGKHAVVAYKVVELNDQKRVYIYENNSPLNSKKAENYISFKLNTNNIEYPQAAKLEFDKAVAIGRWQFENTTEIKESIESTVKKYLLGLVVENIMIFNIHSPVEPIVIDDLGRKAGYLNGELINEIPSARIEQQLDSHLFYLPADLSYNFELVGTNSGVVGIDVIEPLNEKETSVKIFDSIPVEKGKIIDIYWNENEKKVVDTAGNDVLPKNTGIINNTTANIVYGARQLKEQAFEKLSSAKLENKKWNNLISRTASEIESGLKDEYWQDQDHLNYPQGVNTFTADTRAAAAIEVYLHINHGVNGFWKKNLPENTRTVIEGVVENLVKADRKLAEISITEAKTKNGGVHKKMIEQAEKAFDKAEKLQTDHPAAAIDFYKNAWLFSQKSIRLKHGR